MSSNNNNVKANKKIAEAQQEARQKRAKLMASLVIHENPKNDFEREENFQSSSRAVVGAVWVKNPAAWWIPRGLEWANDPANPLPPYLPPFFGADREYGPDEGWQTVRHTTRRRPRRNRRKAKQMEEDESDQIEPVWMGSPERA